jgi:hypothetical protein
LDNFEFGILAFIVFCIAGYFEYRRHNKPCEKCGGKLKVIRVKDPLGKNITKTITIGLDLGSNNHKKLVKYKCTQCGCIANKTVRN